jgi:hypothetical protein
VCPTDIDALAVLACGVIVILRVEAMAEALKEVEAPTLVVIGDCEREVLASLIDESTSEAFSPRVRF